MDPASIEGRELGNYVVRSLLGEGGMGAVFAGEHRFLGTPVAIKILHGSYSNDDSAAQRFFQEAKSSLSIGHPNIIKILDFGQSDDGMLYLVMELLHGQSLADAIRDGTFSEAATARIATEIANGLDAAHKKGIVHRDLKPDNIFLVGEDVKILDFGIAKLGGSVSTTRTGALMGTPRYMAPEQTKGAKHVGPAADLYALGVILFEMLTGQPPFPDEEIQVLLVKHLFEPPPRPSSLVPVSSAMESIVLQCLEKAPSARPASMLELKRLLAPLIGTGPAEHRPSRRMTAASPMSAPRLVAQPSTLGGTASELMRSPSTSSSGRRARWIGVAAAVVVVAGLGLGAARYAKKGAAPPVEPASSVDLQIISEPGGARVTVNGAEQVMRTPSVFKVSRAEHFRVRIEKDGYKLHEETLTLSLNESVRAIFTTLERDGPSGGTIKVRTNVPRGAWTLDGRPIGDGSGALLVREVDAGPHRLKLEAPSFVAKEDIVDVRTAQVNELAWTLVAQQSGHRSADSKRAEARHPTTGSAAPPTERSGSKEKNDAHVGTTNEF